MRTIYVEPPRHWQRLPMKALVHGPINGAWGNEEGQDEVNTVCVRVADFDWDHLVVNLKNPTIRSIKKSQFARLSLRSGDLLLEKSGGGEKTPVGRVVAYNVLGAAISSNFVAFMRPKPQFSPLFLKYLFAAHYMSGFTTQFIKQATGIQNLDDKELMQTVVWIPPADEQETISKYLEKEVSRIDNLIERKILFIKLLHEKSLAVAAHAVTRGIVLANDFVDDAPAWLGQVRGTWTTHRIAELFREIVRPADPELPVLAVSIHDGVSDKELADEDRLRAVNLSEDRTKYQRVRPGDLVYNMMRAWQGAFGAVTVDGLVSPAYVVAEPKAEFRTKFIELQLRTASGAEEVRRYSKGIADFRQRLYWEHFRNLKVCLPPLAEQDDIIAHIESEQARLALLKSKTERSIELLQEHRTALITAAVTGKIDVSAHVSHNLEAAA